VEGLIDYYHFTGEHRALEAAIGIGENVLRLLDTPIFHKPGSANARETGWALRTLTALYKETGEEHWLTKGEWIVGHFEEWKKEYGLWLSPYMDHTSIRVVFMISIAVCSLMRYYRVRPSERIKQMMLEAVDDLVENARLENGLFYYKELPSLKRNGNNTIILEALSYAYELTGDKKYLEAGMKTFEVSMSVNQLGGMVAEKKIVGDAVIVSGPGPKGFAQSFLPLVTYYRLAAQEGLLTL
jgi:lantibiotic modifying enzyme